MKKLYTETVTADATEAASMLIDNEDSADKELLLEMIAKETTKKTTKETTTTTTVVVG